MATHSCTPELELKLQCAGELGIWVGMQGIYGLDYQEWAQLKESWLRWRATGQQSFDATLRGMGVPVKKEK